MDSRPKILVVDDKPENLVAIRTVLKNLDIDLVEASSGNEALKTTLHHDFALALLDIQMPEMDGYELASILREEEKTAHLPFIFISAVYTDNLNVFKGYEKGAFSFITKPFQPEILINKVKFFIDKHQQEVSLFKLNQNLNDKNKELEDLNMELESFTYSVSHDLRAPLRAVNGYVKILEEDYYNAFDEEGQRILSNIEHYSDKMGILIDELLAFSRLGRTELKKSHVDMQIITENVIHEINKNFPNKAEFKFSKLPFVSGDQTLLYQVMYNLLSNAVKYSSKKENPLIEIVSNEENHDIIFMIKDNGAGFDMHYANKLFGVFQRLHSPEEFEGVGVGLAIVNRIISKHGGTVSAFGKPDEGATFSFSLKK